MWPRVERLIERFDGSRTLRTVIRRSWASFLPTDLRAGCTSARSASVPRRREECEDCGEETFLCPRCHKSGGCSECEEEDAELPQLPFSHALTSHPPALTPPPAS